MFQALHREYGKSESVGVQASPKPETQQKKTRLEFNAEALVDREVSRVKAKELTSSSSSQKAMAQNYIDWLGKTFDKW